MTINRLQCLFPVFPGEIRHASTDTVTNSISGHRSTLRGKLCNFGDESFPLWDVESQEFFHFEKILVGRNFNFPSQASIYNG